MDFFLQSNSAQWQGNMGALRSMFDYHEVCVYVSSYHSDLRRIHQGRK